MGDPPPCRDHCKGPAEAVRTGGDSIASETPPRGTAEMLALLLAEIDDLDASVHGVGGIGGIERCVRALADRLEPRRRDPVIGDEIVAHGLGAALREFDIMLVASRTVGVAFE